MIEQQIPAVTLTTQTLKDLLVQIDFLIQKAETDGSNRAEALKSFKIALQAVMPFVPESRPAIADEVELENEIREEIMIAGANENG